jgi:tetratricopeptide (TPR) repeat protein
MILGTDFLRSHRVLVSRSQNRIYFSYTGGLVFPSTPSIDCDERLQGKGAREALAALDEAIAKDPRDTRALLNRALIRLRQGRAKDALPDLDAVLAIEPSNASALAARSAVRTTLRQYDGALADAQSAIDNGMRTAAMYVRRAQIRRAQGDVAGALEEYGHALELDPHDNAALRGRGVALYAAGRFEEAQRDFETALAVRPDGYAALWVAATRMRRGSEPAAPLEAALARLGEGDWPRPIVLHLLGRLDREGLLAAAAPDEKLARGRKCEARFFAAQRLVATAQPAAARLLLQQVLDECPRDYYEYEGAIADLKRLP